MRRVFVRSVAASAMVAVLATGCGSDDNGSPTAESEVACYRAPSTPAITAADVAAADLTGAEITLVTHDAFVVSAGVIEQFETETGIDVELLTSADAGTMVAQSVLTAGDPVADVLFGIDNTFMCAALEAEVFLPYDSPALAMIPDELELDPHRRLTPVDVADVCVNVWETEVDLVPESIDDLTRAEYSGLFVTQNPETSSPGLSFLLATIARYGVGGWEDYWRGLRDNDVLVTSGWSEAYFDEFTAGGGDRPIVTSYATSPVAEVLFADPPTDAAPTVVLTDTCYRQVEFAGVLDGTDEPEAAAALVEFLVSPTFQRDVPLSMFVRPAVEGTEIDPLFTAHAATVTDPLQLDPAEVQANRNEWTERWVEIVLR